MFKFSLFVDENDGLVYCIFFLEEVSLSLLQI